MSPTDLLACTPLEFAQELGRTLHQAVDDEWEDDGQKSELKWNEFTKPFQDLSIHGLTRHLTHFYLHAASSARAELVILEEDDQGRSKRWKFLNHRNAIEAFVKSFHTFPVLQKVFRHSVDQRAHADLPLLERLLRDACDLLQRESLTNYQEVNQQIVLLRQKPGEKPSDFLRRATDLYQRSGGAWRYDPAWLKGGHLLSKLDTGLQGHITGSQQFSATSYVGKKLPLNYSQNGGEEKIDGAIVHCASMTDLDEIATAYWRIASNNRGNNNGKGPPRGNNPNQGNPRGNNNGQGNRQGNGNGNNRGGGHRPVKKEGTFFLKNGGGVSEEGDEILADHYLKLGNLALINPRTLGDLDEAQKAIIRKAREECARLIGAGTKQGKKNAEACGGPPKVTAEDLTTEQIRELKTLRRRAHVCFNCFSPLHLVSNCPYLNQKDQWVEVGKKWKAVADRVRATSN